MYAGDFPFLAHAQANALPKSTCGVVHCAKELFLESVIIVRFSHRVHGAQCSNDDALRHIGLCPKHGTRLYRWELGKATAHQCRVYSLYSTNVSISLL